MLGSRAPKRRADRFDAFARAAPTAVLALALAACAVPAPLETADERRPPVDLRRSGSLSDTTGAAVPIALCARSAALARAMGLPPALLRLPAVCGAAGRL